MEKKLRLGLDIGTNSVGYALVDENGQIIKKNNHAFWGVRMFDEANTAKDRGNFRRGRRRLQRRKERVKIIRDLFANEISNVDKTFYERLDDSFYYTEDKKNKNTYNLFTEGYTDKEFYNEYPTIYHLRKAMQEEDKKFDIRMLYLAVLHIVKYRGNFLYPGDSFNTSNFSLIKEVFNDLNQTIKELSAEFEEDDDYNEKHFDTIEVNDEFLNKLKDILVNTRGITNKKSGLLAIFKDAEGKNVDKKSIYNEFVIPLLAGTKVNVSNLSIVKDNKYEKHEIDFSKEPEVLEQTISEASNEIKELASIIEFVPRIKEIVDFFFVSKLLNSSKSISEAMVKIYDNHQKDLKDLKNFFKTYAKESYNDVFRNVDVDGKGKHKVANYPAYVGINSTGDVLKRFSHASKDDFYKFLKNKIESINVSNLTEDEKEIFNKEKTNIISKIDASEFLLRQNSNQNGAFPMQLHLMELKKILENQSKYYPFLNEVSDGYTVIDKIILTFKFKVPYYIGPLNNKSEKAWVVRNNNDKIYPWNFDKVINKDESAKEFILRMQNKCSYLKGDDDYCLPKKSLIFSEYNCLSYLNKLSINGSPISYELKMKVFNDVFLTKKQPTKKDLIEYFKNNYGKEALTTTSKELPEVNCNMQSYIKMKEIFKEDFENNKDMIENIIKDITIFEDKSILENRLRNVYKLDNIKIKEIKNLNYKDYGRLCKRLLNELPVTDQSTGEVKGTVLSIMRETNMNLQEILYDENYKFQDTIDAYNKKFIKADEDYSVGDFVEDNLIISPSFKRSLIQSYTIIEEIEKIFNRPIDEYYVECTRSNKAEKKATKSRYEQLKELYKECKNIALDYSIKLDNLNENLDKYKDSLKSDLLYLYFTQLGKCMYSLEDIDLDDLIHNNYNYDVDHIYPQSLIKDDSKSNRVLVKKDLNNKKQDKFLFETGYITPKHKAFFAKLFDLGLISKEKYKRLTQNEISSEVLDEFVNRQIVSTNQSVKGLITLLKNYHNVDEANIIYSKAENVSDFRHEFDLVKSRTANNFHHAHDAYLNVIVGGVLDKYFKFKRFYRYQDKDRMKVEGYTTNPSKVFERKIIEQNQIVIWNKEKMLKLINKNLYERFDISETFKTKIGNEMYSHVSVYPKGSGNLVPFQTTTPRFDIKKYGGIAQASYSKYVLIKTKEKKGDCTILEPIPRNAVDNIEGYLKTKYNNFEILHDNIKTNVIIEEGKKRYTMTGVTGNAYYLKNISDRFFSKKAMITIKKIDKYLENIKFENRMEEKEDEIIISPARNNKTEAVIITKNDINSLLKELTTMYNKEIYSYNCINTLKDKMDKCYELSLNDALFTISEMLNLLKTNERKTANLLNIGLAKEFGVIKLNKKLNSGLKFVSESITGYYKKVLYEVK